MAALADGSGENNLMTIPVEVRDIVLTRLPQSAVLKMRLVSRQIRNEVDKSFVFTLPLDDTNDDRLKWTIGLKIKELTVLQLIMPVYKPLKYPTWVKILKIETDFIVPANFLLLLKQVACTVERLIVTSDVILIPPPPSDIIGQLELKQLKILKLQNGPDRNSYNRRKSRIPHEGTLLKYMNCEKLEKLKLNINYRSCTQGQPRSCHQWPLDIINFMARCHKTLKRLNLKLFNFCTTHPSTEFILNLFHAEEEVKINQLLDLKTVKIEINQSEQFTGKVLEILLRQQSMETIRIEDYFTYHLSGPGIHRTVIMNNQSTLKVLNIMDFGYEGNTPDGRPIPFDLGLLEECPNLIRLTISRSVQRRVRIHPYGPELINCAHLPMNLELLDISNLLFNSEDMLAYTKDRNRTAKLRTLELASYIPEEIGFGVTSRILFQILRLPNILKLVIDNFSTPNLPNDRLLLDAVSKKFNCPLQLTNPTAVLRIERSVVEAAWTPMYSHV